MADKNDNAIDVLNDLIETSHDGKYGFAMLAEHAKAPALKQNFQQRTESMHTAIAELHAAVVQHGGKPVDRGTASGAVHRGWVSVRSALSTSTDQALLDEAERGEDAALARYRKAAKQDDLPPAVHSLIERQLQGVQRNHDQIKALRDQHQANHA